ncbi:hypothetical protein C0J52_09873, partial [Blattella germanica]
FIFQSKHTEFISGERLAELLKNNPQNLALAVKIMEILNMARSEGFFRELEDIKLSSKVQDKIAETLVRWLPNGNSNWTFSRFRMIEKVGDPLIAHFPPHFLADLSNSEAIRCIQLFHFRNWLWSNLPFDAWSGKLASAKRIWSDMMFRSAYPVHVTKWTENEGRGYFLEGATPDELQLFTVQQLQNSRLFRVKLGKLQVRALFNVMYPDGELSSANLTEGQLYPVALKLLPQNLQRFNVTLTDFKILFTLHDEKYSYSTAFQILESLIAQSVFLGRLKNTNPETWGNSIEHLGKFIHILPVNVLKQYNITPTSPLVHSSIDSYKLTSRQARLLTGGVPLDPSKPDMMLGRKGLLRALPSSQLATKIMLPQSLLSHLLTNLPAGRHIQAASLLLRVGKLNGKTWALKSILTNKNPNQFFELLDSQAVTTLVEDIKSMKGFDRAIKSLPYNTLSALLTSHRTKLTNENILWTSDSLLSEENVPSLLGLSCNDIYAMETVDFIHIMEIYNKERELLNKPFPKDLQYCSQMALINYLEKKASLQDKMDYKLLDYLEPSEIAAVGGYILGNLNIGDIKDCIYKKHILEAIGQLPLPEFLIATKESNPWKLASLLLEQYAHTSPMINGEGLFGLGNLFSFLPSSDIEKINPVSFKLFMESMSDSKSKALCITDTSRSALYDVIVKSFGEPYKWTPGILATLGDVLIVLSSKMLNSIPESSWRDAADVLIDQTSYHLKMEWPGKINQISFHQSQIDTVMNASELLTLTKHATKGRTDRKLITDIPLEVVRPENVVKVLDTNFEKQMEIDRIGHDNDDTTETESSHNNGNPIEQSGEVLRAVLQTNQIDSRTKVPNQTTTTITTEMVKIEQREHGERHLHKISCHAIRAAGQSASLAIDEKIIELLEPEELDDCVETLGSLELDISVQKKIWNSMNKEKFYENVSDLGNLLKVLDIDDINHINVNLDTLQELGLHFLKSNPNIRTFTTEVTVALSRILCDVLERSSHKLHDLIPPNTFLKASPILGQMKTCPAHCLHKLAHLAMKPTEYGSLENWTAEDVATLGIIPAEHWRKLQSTGYGNNPLVGLQPSAVKFIPPQLFKELNEDQLKSLPTLSSAVVSEEQKSHLSESQQEALVRVQTEVPVLKPSILRTRSQSKASDSIPAKSILLLLSTALAVMTVF